MSKATFTFGRFNPPTEVGHGKLVSAVQAHAEKSGGTHYIFPSHSQDAKKNPLSHGDKVHAMNRLFPNANVVSNAKIRTAIDAMKHLEKKGHTDVTMVVGSDRVAEFHGLLSKYRKKEFPGIKKVNVVSAGQRDPDAEGEEGESASKHRALVAAGKRKEFISKYSDKKLGAHIHDRVKAGMQMESVNPVGIFLLGGPGSGKDYVLKNIFSRFDLTEVQADQILSGIASELLESKKNIVINGVNDEEKISVVQSMLEGYAFDFIHVNVTNKVSRLRNEQREQPISESKRIDKFLKAEKLSEKFDCFRFNNSINLNESSELEKVFFASQIEKLLERVVGLGLQMKSEPEPKSFFVIREKVKEPTGKLKDACWTGYTAVGMKTKNGRKVPNCVPVKEQKLIAPDSVEQIAKKHDVSVASINDQLAMGVNVEMEHTKDKAVAKNIALNHLKELPDYYTRLKAIEAGKKKPVSEQGQIGLPDKPLMTQADKTTHNMKVQRQARVAHRWMDHRNADMHRIATAKEEIQIENIDQLFEMQLVGTDEYRKHAIAMTPGQGEIENAYTDKKPVQAKESNEDCGCGNDADAKTGNGNGESVPRRFRDLRTEAKKEKEISVSNDTSVNLEPVFDPQKKKPKNAQITPPTNMDSVLQGLPVTSRFNAYEETEKDLPTLEEAVSYHLENKISFTENVFRPGSEMFFAMMKEAKRLYKEGKYTPSDEYEEDLLNSDIGEKVVFEGQEVMLDFPFAEEINEEGGSDPTGGKGIGKPFRQGGGGAVYVRSGDGVRKITFSNSGMAKKYNDPARVRSFVARHHCLTNKDKTSRSYWACRWPRYFSNSGQTWW